MGVEKVEKINILHVVSCLNVDSGVMNFIMNYYRNIDIEKVQFHFVYFIEGENTYKDEIEKLGGKYYFLEKPSLKTYEQYKSFFNKFGNIYKAIHLHEIYLNAILLPLAKKAGIKKLITHSHATRFSDKKLSAIRNRILCTPIKQTANRYFACSKAAGVSVYGSKYVELGKVSIINNAVDIKKFKFNLEVREKLRAQLLIKDKLVIGHVGRFNEQKNHLFLIDIFLEVLKIRNNSILMLLGDGPLYEEIEDKIRKLGIEKSVMLLGRKNNIEEYLQAMDVFVLPSLFEGLPVVGVEAQTAGLPCIFSSEITEEIDIKNCMFLDLNEEVSTWAKIIVNSVDGFIRQDTSRDIEEAGFSIKIECEKLVKEYIN